MEELVLLTVGLAHHAPYLRLSHALLANSLRGRRWVLVDNSADEALRPLARECSFEWVEGAVLPELAACPPAQVGSMHHALGLTRGLGTVSARYLLVLDPDFFLLSEGALAALVARMKNENLVALGAPWTAELHYKWRRAPCLHCLLLDLKQIPKEALRFEPADNQRANDPINRARFARLFRPWRPVLGSLHQLTTGRIGIGQSRDTGWQLAGWLLRHHADRIGLLPAAVVGRSRFRHPWHLRYGWGWHFEQLLPQRWSYLPPTDHYRLSEGADLSDIGHLGLDAFYLKDRIFALHVRRSRSIFADAGEEAAYIERLSELLHRLAAAPAEPNEASTPEQLERHA